MGTVITSFVCSVLLAKHAPSYGVNRSCWRWRRLTASLRDPYRPELHYMRGPARNGARSTAVRQPFFRPDLRFATVAPEVRPLCPAVSQVLPAAGRTRLLQHSGSNSNAEAKRTALVRDHSEVMSRKIAHRAF